MEAHRTGSLRRCSARGTRRGIRERQGGVDCTGYGGEDCGDTSSESPSARRVRRRTVPLANVCMGETSRPPRSLTLTIRPPRSPNPSPDHDRAPNDRPPFYPHPPPPTRLNHASQARAAAHAAQRHGDGAVLDPVQRDVQLQRRRDDQQVGLGRRAPGQGVRPRYVVFRPSGDSPPTPTPDPWPTSATYISPIKPTLSLRLLPNPHDTLSHVHRTCRVPHAFVGLRPPSAPPQPCIAERSWSERGPAHSGSAANPPPQTLPLTQTRTPCPCIPLVHSLLRSVRRCVCSNTPPSIAPAPLFPLPPRSLRSHPPTSPSTPAPQTPS